MSGRLIPKNARVIDGSGHILGRLASIVARMLLNGENVIIVNAEKIIVSGKRKRVIDSYKLLFKVTTLRNPYKSGIRRPRSPENIVRRAIRGMLPYYKPKGRQAYRRLRVFTGVPPELKSVKFERIEEAEAKRLGREYITVKDIAIEMGWKPRW